MKFLHKVKSSIVTLLASVIGKTGALIVGTIAGYLLAAAILLPIIIYANSILLWLAHGTNAFRPMKTFEEYTVQYSHTRKGKPIPYDTPESIEAWVEDNLYGTRSQYQNDYSVFGLLTDEEKEQALDVAYTADAYIKRVFDECESIYLKYDQYIRKPWKLFYGRNRAALHDQIAADRQAIRQLLDEVDWSCSQEYPAGHIMYKIDATINLEKFPRQYSDREGYLQDTYIFLSGMKYKENAGLVIYSAQEYLEYLYEYTFDRYHPHLLAFQERNNLHLCRERFFKYMDWTLNSRNRFWSQFDIDYKEITYAYLQELGYTGILNNES